MLDIEHGFGHDIGERIEIACGPVRASFGLGEIYEDTDLAAA